ncbi:MAG: NAD+ synthase [Methanothrix sp.]|uniref:NAD+ synthase n=1 Tax=Methanothrix sp. TaxID=90426 RepID=UPI00247B78E3|nr:NAD+ synthase [Methanothrix sp.]
MRAALLQINTTVGDLEGNASLIRKAVESLDADLAITHEMSLLGYPPRDLLLMPGFVSKAWDVLRRLALDLKDSPPVLVGIPEPNISDTGRTLFNSAALLADGSVKQIFRKTLLPAWDLFDEERYFEPASGPQMLNIKGRTFGISICEDIWNDRSPFGRRRYQRDPLEDLRGADCFINMSASPFTAGKHLRREMMLSTIARKYGVPLIYVNQVGGNDDLVFDGRSCAFTPSGELMARAAAFEEDVLVVDMDSHSGHVSRDDFSPESEIWRALVLGTRDYVRKCGFTSAVIGLSGGIDSSLTAAVAAEALGPENVTGVLMPSPYTSRESMENALELARNLRIKTITIPITEIMMAFERTLEPVFRDVKRDVTEENIQARIRGNILMALSNKFGHIVLSTGNKSELAVGYCTIYGDMSGGFSVLSDVPKTMVYRIARWINRRGAVIPPRVLERAPSAELRPGQRDQDVLPPYEILDEILHRHIEQHQSEEEIASAGFDPELVRYVLRMIKTAEFKRKQAPPGIRVTDRAFGSGWRMPIACRM